MVKHVKFSFSVGHATKTCKQYEHSPRRYNFLKYDDGDVFGGGNECRNSNVIRTESWWSWLVHCSNCFCYCDEPGAYSDRYFSLRAIVSNTNENR